MKNFQEVYMMKKYFRSALSLLLSLSLMIGCCIFVLGADDTTPVIVINDITANPLVSTVDGEEELVFDFSDLEVDIYFMDPFTDSLSSLLDLETLQSYVSDDGDIDILTLAMDVLGVLNITEDVLALVSVVTEIYSEITEIIDIADPSSWATLTEDDLNEIIESVQSTLTTLPYADLTAFAEEVQAVLLNSDGTSVDDSISAGFWDESVGNYTRTDLYSERLGELGSAMVSQYGKNNVYVYLYDWRLDPYDNTDTLAEFIESVKSQSGSDEVNIIAEGYGALLATTYLSEYADDAADSVNNLVLISSAFNGTSLIGDIYSGELADDYDVTQEYSSALVRYYNDYSDSPLTAAIIWLLSYILNNEWELQSYAYAIVDMLQTEISYYLYDEDQFYSLLAYSAGLWALVPESMYADALAFMYDDTDMDEDLQASVESFKELQANSSDILVAAQESGINVNVVALWDIQILPIGSTCSVQSDGYIDTVYQSYGATCINSNDVTFAKYATQALDTDHDHLSDDFDLSTPNYTIAGIAHYIDASTCALPENTWFISDMKHGTFSEDSNSIDFLYWLLDADEQLTVWSDAIYPQFMSFDRYTGVAGTLETGTTTDTTDRGYLLGDVNLDGYVTALDSVLADQIVNDDLYFESDEYSFINADIDGDGVITEEDAYNILLISAGLMEDMNYVQTSFIEQGDADFSEATLRTEYVYDSSTHTMTVSVYLDNPQDESNGNFVVLFDSDKFTVESVTAGTISSGEVVAGETEYADGVVSIAYKINDKVSSDDLDEDGSLLLATIVLNPCSYAGTATISVGATSYTEEEQYVYINSTSLEVDMIDFLVVGDLDGDGYVSYAEARAALRHALDIEYLTDESSLIAADADQDGEITLDDVRAILRLAADLEDDGEDYTITYDGVLSY